MRTRHITLLLIGISASFGCGSATPSVETDASPGRNDGSTANRDGSTDASRDAGQLPPGNGGRLVARDFARVFFSGHSLLTTPDLIEPIAQSRGEDLNWNQQNIPGSPIRVRTAGSGGWEGYRQGQNRGGEGMNVIAELRSPSTLGANERYDTLMITERNDPLNTLQWERTADYLRHYHDRLIEGNPNAHTIFHQAWPAMENGAPYPWIDYVKAELTLYECIATRVNLTLELANRPDRVSVVPGGYALAVLTEQVLAGNVRGVDGSERDRVLAIFSDDVHLAPMGLYFMALVHYAELFGKSPVGAWAPNGISAETATDLQEMAWSILSEYHATETPWQHTMDHCRQQIAEVVCVTNFRDFRPDATRLGQCGWYRDNVHEADHPLRWPNPDYAPLPAPP